MSKYETEIRPVHVVVGETELPRFQIACACGAEPLDFYTTQTKAQVALTAHSKTHADVAQPVVTFDDADAEEVAPLPGEA